MDVAKLNELVDNFATFKYTAAGTPSSSSTSTRSAVERMQEQDACLVAAAKQVDASLSYKTGGSIEDVMLNPNGTIAMMDIEIVEGQQRVISSALLKFEFATTNDNNKIRSVTFQTLLSNDQIAAAGEASLEEQVSHPSVVSLDAAKGGRKKKEQTRELQ